MLGPVFGKLFSKLIGPVFGGGGSGPTPPAGAIRDRSGAYIRDRAGNYIKVR